MKEYENAIPADGEKIAKKREWKKGTGKTSPEEIGTRTDTLGKNTRSQNRSWQGDKGAGKKSVKGEGTSKDANGIWRGKPTEAGGTRDIRCCSESKRQ